MLDLFHRFFGREQDSSKDAAKERLRLVLIHDRASLSPEMLEALRRDLIVVISKYMDIDEKGIEVNLDRSDHTVALLASIPVKRVKRAAAGESRAKR